MRIWIRNTAFALANLRICDLPINHYKFADFRTGTPNKICGFVIAEWAREFDVFVIYVLTKKNLRAHTFSDLSPGRGEYYIYSYVLHLNVGRNLELSPSRSLLARWNIVIEWGNHAYPLTHSVATSPRIDPPLSTQHMTFTHPPIGSM